MGGVSIGGVSIRYIVDDVEQAIAFYGTHLGFEVELHPAPGFARLRRGDLRLLLNAPGAGGAGTAGGTPEPGGWNRFQLTVDNLDDIVARLEQAGASMRSGIVDGQGGRQALVADPSGNLVELFEPRSSS